MTVNSNRAGASLTPYPFVETLAALPLASAIVRSVAAMGWGQRSLPALAPASGMGANAEYGGLPCYRYAGLPSRSPFRLEAAPARSGLSI